MPLKKSASKETTEENFHEFKHGKTYSRTKRKYGAKVANRQMVAAVLSNKRKSAKRGNKKASYKR